MSSRSYFSRFPVQVALLALLGAGVFVGVLWFTASDAPPPRAPVAVAPAAVPPKPGPALPAPPPLPKPDPLAIDPEVQRLADDLASRSQSPVRDLEIVGGFIEMYRKVFQQGNPIGLNEDITAVLTGQNARKGILFPPGSPMIVRGQLVDRWGTPYWFHPNNSHQMEIRSAGPDKDLFTPDDVVLNPSPAGHGAEMVRR